MDRGPCVSDTQYTGPNWVVRLHCDTVAWLQRFDTLKVLSTRGDQAVTARLIADTVTDDQIRALRSEYLADRSLSGVDTCDVALGRHGASRNPRRVARARARCVEILSRRAARRA